MSLPVQTRCGAAGPEVAVSNVFGSPGVHGANPRQWRMSACSWPRGRGTVGWQTVHGASADGAHLAWGAVQFASAGAAMSACKWTLLAGAGVLPQFYLLWPDWRGVTHLGMGLSLLPLVIKNSFMGRTDASAEGDPMCVRAGSLLLGWARGGRPLSRARGCRQGMLSGFYRQGIGSCVCVVWQSLAHARLEIRLHGVLPSVHQERRFGYCTSF